MQYVHKHYSALRCAFDREKTADLSSTRVYISRACVVRLTLRNRASDGLAARGEIRSYFYHADGTGKCILLSERFREAPPVVSTGRRAPPAHRRRGCSIKAVCSIGTSVIVATFSALTVICHTYIFVSLSIFNPTITKHHSNTIATIHTGKK